MYIHCCNLNAAGVGLLASNIPVEFNLFGTCQNQQTFSVALENTEANVCAVH